MNDIDLNNVNDLLNDQPKKPNLGNLLLKEKLITSIFWKFIVFMFAGLSIAVAIYTAFNANVMTIVLTSITFVFFIIVMAMRLKKE